MEIEFYTAPNGRKPARDFLDALSPKMRAKMIDKVKYLQELGHLLRPPASKHLRGEIYELMAQAEGNITRILYFFVVGDKAVLTHGFTKKTESTPAREIRRAEESRKQYLKEHGEG